jgi:hypothetical protein
MSILAGLTGRFYTKGMTAKIIFAVNKDSELTVLLVNPTAEGFPLIYHIAK